jgi:AAA15 family ATPase/GTPase
LSLESDFNILYGLNGSGKTQILDCVKKTILKDDSFGEELGLWGWRNTSYASLVYEIADDSKEASFREFDQYTRMWHQPIGSSLLPSKFEVLAALGVSEDIPLAQRSEI